MNERATSTAEQDMKSKSFTMKREEIEALVSTLSQFVHSYGQKAEGTSDGEWLLGQLKEALPEKSSDAVAQICDTIISGIKQNEEMKASLRAAQSKGMSREHWFAKRMEKATEGMSGEDARKCMQGAYSALESANAGLWGNLTNGEAKTPEIVFSPSLIADGQDWNSYTLKTAAKNIVQSAGMVGLQGILARAKDEIERQISEGNFDTAQFLENSLKAGGANVKTILAGALETVSEKGLLGSLPQGTSAGAATDIAHIAVENMSILNDIAEGELTPSEGIEKAGDAVVETVCAQVESGIRRFGAEALEAIGGLIGSVFGPAGMVLGAVAGKALGSFAGSKVGQMLTNGAKKVYNYAKEKVFKPLSNAVSSAWEGVKSFVSNLVSW